ncbi:hypothetical protein RJ639_003141 [Escallonia herrerae]|uniref:Prohibitin n=1 Tax=Escallonia herrerae TaxID=1293975 RepID=A0AA88W4Z6_9ASTE|nr:hypothetical protein RJ639_003141 [Escallonia herrerae]
MISTRHSTRVLGLRNMSDVRVPKMPGGGAASALIKLSVISGLGIYGFANSLYNVDGGHHAIVFNRIVGVKDKIGQDFRLMDVYYSVVIPVNETLMDPQAHKTPLFLGFICDIKTLSASHLQRLINKYWHLRGDVCVEKLPNIFLRHFDLEYEAELVLHNGPWNFEGTVLILREWIVHMIYVNVTFPKMDLWVRVHSFPSYYYSTTLAE